MKPPRFWYPREKKAFDALAAAMLSPLSWGWAAGGWLRGLLARPYRARVPVICVGNTVAGGAGKTPTCLALAQILKASGQKPVFITRGYGGHGELACVNRAQHQAEDVGDEALLLAASAPTWAGRDRVAAARQAESHGTVIIMDDGLQNPHIAPTASILVIDGDVGIGNGRMIPAGPLRETLERALKRVAAVIIIGEQDLQNVAAHIKVPVFRAHLQPKVDAGLARQGPFVAFAGIARPEKFYATARGLGLQLVETVDFPDHHLFDESDLQGLRLRAEIKGARLLTTEKDAVRLSPDFRADCLIVPVELVFDDSDAAGKLARICLSL